MRKDASDVGICIPFFAAGPAPRRNTNLRKSLAKLGECDAKQVLVVECDMGHAQTRDLEGTVSHIVKGDPLWQKERLMQIGCEMLIQRGYRKIVCMDGDCLIERDDWLYRVSRCLRVNRACQCFGTLQSIGDERTLTGRGAVAELKATGKHKRVVSGGIWAYHADVIEACGLWQRCIVGSGDVAHFLGMVDPDAAVKVFADWGYTKAFQRALKKWAVKWKHAVNNKIDYIPCEAVFQSHGRRDARKCGERHALLHDYDPKVDVAVTAPGQGLRWQGKNKALHNRVAAYARHRSA